MNKTRSTKFLLSPLFNAPPVAENARSIKTGADITPAADPDIAVILPIILLLLGDGADLMLILALVYIIM